MKNVIGVLIVLVGLVAVLVAGNSKALVGWLATPGWCIFAIGVIVLSLRLHANPDSGVVTAPDPEADTEKDDGEDEEVYEVNELAHGVFQIDSSNTFAEALSRFIGEHPLLRVTAVMVEDDDAEYEADVLLVVTEPRS